MKAQLQWILGGVLLLVTGIFVLANPTTVMKIAVIIFGLYLMIESIFALALTWKIRKLGSYFTVNSVRTLASLAIGILVLYFALTSPGAAVASWMVYLVAAWLLVSSLLELLEIWMLKRSGYESFGVTTSALVSLVISLIMFLFPVMINNAIFMAVGIVMIVIAVFLIIWAVRMILFERRLKEEARKSETDWEEL